jgi:N-acetylneuraminate lyase
MDLNKFKGIIPALLTPFNNQGKINKDSTVKLIDYCLEQGVDGFYIGGSTGEAFLMTMEERKELIKVALTGNAGRKTSICQVGAVGTAMSIELARWAEKNGADAVSAVAPFYYPFTKDQIITHYKEVTNSVSIPMIVYNIPGLSGVNLSEDDFKRLYEHERIIGVKHTHHNLYEMERIKSIDPERLIFFGFDEVTLAGISMGADGAIGSTFNFMAGEYIKLKKLFLAGKHAESLEVQTRINEVISTFLQLGVFASLKYALSSRRGIDMGEVRAPFTPLNTEGKLKVDKVLEKMGL